MSPVILILDLLVLFLLYQIFFGGGTREIKRPDIYRERTYIGKVRWPFAALLLSRFSPRWSNIFFEAVFSMLAKMAKATGTVTQHEFDALEEFMTDQLNLSTEQKRRAYDILRHVRHSSHSFEDYARGYFRMFGRNRLMLENMVDLLLAIAYADNKYTFEEHNLIKAALEIFQMSEADFERIKARHIKARRIYEQKEEPQESARQGQKRERRTNSNERARTTAGSRSREERRPPEKPQLTELERQYEILGCSSKDSADVIKRQHRRLVKQYHPDNLARKGTPPELIAFCTTRFREVQAAFEAVKKHKGFN